MCAGLYEPALLVVVRFGDLGYCHNCGNDGSNGGAGLFVDESQSICRSDNPVFQRTSPFSAFPINVRRRV